MTEVLDLTPCDEHQVAAALRRGRERLDGARSLVVDLGERRTLPAEAIEELVLICRAVTDAGGRCAVVLGPSLAVQVAIAHPEGILWTTTRAVAIDLLRPNPAALEVRCEMAGERLRVRLSGELDLAGLAFAQARLAEVVDFAATGREVVLDLGGLTFVDVAGLRAITQTSARSRLAGAQTRVTGAQPQFLGLLRRLGWQNELPGVVERRTPARLRGTHPQRREVRRLAILTELEDQFDDGREAVIATDLGGTVTHWNGAARRLYGWSRAEALGRPITELTVGPTDERVAREIMETVRRTGLWEGEFEVCRKDGTTFRAHVRDSIIEDGDGRPVGLVGTSIAL